MKISIIVAKAINNVIGNDNKLLWHLNADMKYFKGLTTGHNIIMGRKTYDSIGKALPNRNNIVISRNEHFKADGCYVVKNLQEAIEFAKKNKFSETDDELFVIGGGQIYKEAMPITDKIYLTEVKQSFVGDAFFPEINTEKWQEISRVSHQKDEKNEYDFDFVELTSN
jgi:dihydrofolate reductase